MTVSQLITELTGLDLDAQVWIAVVDPVQGDADYFDPEWFDVDPDGNLRIGLTLGLVK